MKLSPRIFLAALTLLGATQLPAVALAKDSATGAEPHRQFVSAMRAYARKDYKAAAGDIRAGSRELRRESARANADAREALDTSAARLDTLADSVEKGTQGAEKSMKTDFARAEHALALEHRARAAEAWSRKQYDRTGRELKAAADRLQDGADWLGGHASADASKAVSDARAAGDKLASGAKWSRNEVAAGMKNLGGAIDSLGREIASRG